MSSPNQLIERIYGGDPIIGNQALHELLDLGDAGEEALFSRPINSSDLSQAYRRLLQYVASRQETVVGRLVDRLQNPNKFKDGYSAAQLFAALGEAPDALRAQLKIGFDRGQATSAVYDNYMSFADRFVAWGYAGGEPALLWNYMREDSFAWEKLSTFAFRGACASVARMQAGDCWAIEQLITHEWDDDWDDSKPVKISNSPDAEISRTAIDETELGRAANSVFTVWRRGEIADQILRNWSTHAHWRVRDFGAQILAVLSFGRVVKPVVEWLHREPVPSVRASLLRALGNSATPSGAEALIEHFLSEQEGGQFVAQSVWRAHDKDRAIKVLTKIADGEGVAATEALVSLGRLGQRHARFAESSQSHDHYFRLNAALAYAYLCDRSMLPLIESMQGEAATPLERLYLQAALAILGKPNGAVELHRTLMDTAEEPNFQKRVDVFFLHRFLQQAVIDGLAAGREHSPELLDSWRSELEPFTPIPQLQPLTPYSAQPSASPVVSPSIVRQIPLPMDVPMKPIKILFLASNPTGTGRLALDVESRDIEAKLRSAEYRNVELISKWAVRPGDLLDYFNWYPADIVHFSGHGRGSQTSASGDTPRHLAPASSSDPASLPDEIILEDENGQPKPVDKAALANLFRVFNSNGNIRVVVLNACYSRAQAEAITQHVDCAIGMNKAIGDKAAILFATAFYGAIANKCSVQNAFDQGVLRLQLEGLPEDLTPELLTREGVDASQVFLLIPLPTNPPMGH
ncbi:hypothetical protein IAD21_00721 [Abditibacteriota bacterium]|nr:hypothetical protein IAD21_00721 [Abditibacteriota bacterium]